MREPVQPKQRNQLSRYVVIFITVVFATLMKQTLESRFPDLQALSFLMDLGLYLLLFIPFYFLMSKVADWFIARQ
ncbi:hypothetical protein ACFFUO_19390 [Vibrio artabrorum]|uniref:Uncharacterized protein n=1 Tax=Vibrio artabrorum TaxID=446374 RepID=A0ABT8CLC1_9VIBR|nr:hypothetical protein [Vibrio artabrorum]MDN3701667.1 hypothetical protein [Vibrio artabrorum]